MKLDLVQESLRDDYLAFLSEFSQQIESYCDPERTVDFKKSVATGRAEIGKRVARGNTEIGTIDQSLTAGSDVKISGADLKIKLGETGSQETERQMREIAKEKFYAQIKTFVKQRLVILLDTYEWLHVEGKETQAARWAVTELLPGLYYRMHNVGKRCYLVMTSRIPLGLEGVKKQELEQWKLEMLDQDEVNTYLEAMGIHEPVMQEFIYNLTYGHPHSLSIVSDICEDQWWDQSLHLADLETLRDLFLERARKEVVEHDILERFLKSPLLELTRYGVVLRRFNLPLLRAVFPKWLSDPQASDYFDRLIGYPHVEFQRNSYYAFHKLLREVLAGFIRVQQPDEWKDYHYRALEFLKAKWSQTEPPDWYYHQLACDEEQGRTYWNDIKHRELQEYLEALREVARDRTLKLTPITLQCMDLYP